MELPQNSNNSSHAASSPKKKALFGSRCQQSTVSARQSSGVGLVCFSFIRALFQFSDYQTVEFTQTNLATRKIIGACKIIRFDIFPSRKVARRFSARRADCF